MSALPAGPLWLVGCGNMGGAMLRRWLGEGLDAQRVTVVTRSGCGVPDGVRSLRALPPGEVPGTVLLAVKPQQLNDVAPMLAGIAPRLLLSILAGVDLAALRARVNAEAIVRMMPNLPVAIGEGVVALATDADDATARASAEEWSRPLGHVEWIEDERRFDAVTALAGCGPGFVFRFADALAAAGESLGIEASQAQRLAVATLAGAARMASTSPEPPATLADRVASPGGSTRQGLDILDADARLVELMTHTLAASARRNAELAAAAR